ncbi:MAG TPA: CehA/McbA family metallohydrolase, partial [Candidatus Sumerlaeota bacterium]|nr:CehA/McbA family metallohydrolase [Candidatus Sumerlaeota bacterium]
LRGNLHTHTTQSDGVEAPQAVIDAYAAAGYDFLMLSDHDIFSGAELYRTLDARGMTLIPGNEVTANALHLLHVNGDRRVEPHRNRQQVIDEIAATQGFAIVNHPNWQWGPTPLCPPEELAAMSAFAGMEIFNGVIRRLEGSPYATDCWDKRLSQGERMWGYAHDDSHEPGDRFLGWNMVWSADRGVDALVEALRHGRFYASTGVVIRKLESDGMQVHIEAENADRIVAVTDFRLRLGQSDTNDLTVTVPETKQYVRFECWGRGEEFAWSQPFFVVKD